MAKRGQLTEEIQELAKEFLEREITTRELRLLPYIDYLMKNEQKLDPVKINKEERDFIAALRLMGHLEGGMLGMAITKEFYDFIQKILWIGYVTYEKIE